MRNEAISLISKIICKTVLGLTVMMLLIIPGAVYAQNIKFDSYFNSGIGVVFENSSGLDYSDPFLKVFGADSEQNGFRFRLNGSLSTQAEIAGIKFRFQSQSSLVQGYFSMPYVYGWINLFNDILYMAGGIVDDNTWQTNDWWINDDAGEGLGLFVRVKPMEGLDFGAGVYLISQQAAGSNNILSFGSFLPNFSRITPKAEDAKYTFGASYTMEDVFAVSASFRWKNITGWVSDYADLDKFGYFYEGRQESAQLFGEFRFLMLHRLKAVSAFSMDKLEDFAANGDIILSQTFSYDFRKVMLGLNAVEFIYNRQSVTGKKIHYHPSLLFNLWASYTYIIIEPRLDLVYFWGGRSRAGGNETYMWHRRGFINREAFNTGSDNSRIPSVFSVRPSVRFNLMSRTSVEIGNMFNYDFGNWDGAYGDPDNPMKRSRISNICYIDFRWSF